MGWIEKKGFSLYEHLSDLNDTGHKQSITFISCINTSIIIKYFISFIHRFNNNTNKPMVLYLFIALILCDAINTNVDIL